jgi:hypothetical protein
VRNDTRAAKAQPPGLIRIDGQQLAISGHCCA